jgi:hypothetical protein
MDNTGIVRDSSIWLNADGMAAFHRTDPMIRVGVVKAAFNDAVTGELRYLVGVNSNGREIDVNCIMLRRFGGVYNYEDFINHGYSYQDIPDAIAGYNAKAGDAVLVGQLNGQGRDGIILGGLNHAARTTTIQATDGPQYDAEFNGIHTNINADGEWTLTFKGQPTNLSQLDDAPSDPIPAPTYDLSVGSSYMKFDKQGGWTVSDAAQSELQSIYIDKAAGTITTTSGQISLTMDKNEQSVVLICETTTVNSSDSYSLTTQEYTVDASSFTKINSPQIAIGYGGTELLDQITQALGDIIEFLNSADSTHTHIGNLGYPTGAPINATAFTQLATSLQTIQSAILEIKGSL